MSYLWFYTTSASIWKPVNGCKIYIVIIFSYQFISIDIPVDVCYIFRTFPLHVLLLSYCELLLMYGTSIFHAPLEAEFILLKAVCQTSHSLRDVISDLTLHWPEKYRENTLCISWTGQVGAVAFPKQNLETPTLWTSFNKKHCLRIHTF